MKWMIIIVVMMSLIGSMMWVMPTPRQKYQAALRLKAKQLGFHVQLQRLTAPRAKGEMEPQSRDMIVYRVLRDRLNEEEKAQLNTWQIFRIESIADIGLPSGWSWSEGERTLSNEQLDKVAAMIAKLPQGVFSVESTPLYVGVYWDEEGGDEALAELKMLLDRLILEGF